MLVFSTLARRASVRLRACVKAAFAVPERFLVGFEEAALVFGFAAGLLPLRIDCRFGALRAVLDTVVDFCLEAAAWLVFFVDFLRAAIVNISTPAGDKRTPIRRL